MFAGKRPNIALDPQICNLVVTQLSAAEGRIFDALVDPTLRAILDLLQERPRPAGDIASHFPVSRPAIAKHVRVLKKAGLVRERAEGRHRIYGPNAAPLAGVDRWLQPYRAFWVSRLVTIKNLVESKENANGNG